MVLTVNTEYIILYNGTKADYELELNNWENQPIFNFCFVFLYSLILPSLYWVESYKSLSAIFHHSLGGSLNCLRVLKWQLLLCHFLVLFTPLFDPQPLFSSLSLSLSLSLCLCVYVYVHRHTGGITHKHTDLVAVGAQK